MQAARKQTTYVTTVSIRSPVLIRFIKSAAPFAPVYHRDISDTFLLIRLARNTSSKLITELNKPTAEPKL